jgi:acetyl-CoA C-acetyltransferase
MDRVVILGGYATSMTDFNPKYQFYELPYVSSRELLTELGIDRGELDFIILAAYDHLDGRMISNMYTSMASGGYLKYESRVSEDSLYALAYAYMKIISGEADVGLVTSYATRETDMVYASNLVMDPLYYRNIAMNYLSGLALQASAYLSITKLQEYSDLIASHIVSQQRKAAANNPRAHLKKPLEPSDVISNEYIIWPLRDGMYPPATRGAVSIVIASEEYAKRIRTDPIVYIDSVSWCTDGYYLGNKLLYLIAPLMKASRKAYINGGIEDPMDIDLFLISDVTPFHYLMQIEALGLSPPGRGARLLERGEIGPSNTRLRVNPDGGSLCTDPYPASGILKLYEAYLQLTDRAGPIQLSDVDKVLVHGFSYLSGASSQSHIVTVLSRW